MSYPYVFSVLPPYQLYLIARFGAIPFSRYRIVQGTHLNSPPLHHPLTASRYRRSTATDLDSLYATELTSEKFDGQNNRYSKCRLGNAHHTLQMG
ncbi:hypothetical protein CKA32_002120 [Geitlerinema sp. FC II]|nr:hypothetical protein CKA32_002120 [Geitlerinema sp. FC II]